ncbi:MAG TPA: GntR family transcriptional regulator [Candidatus Faecivivens stercoravium]|uniref:GntR family transcriptional regulator n=1 Tax=Candidatus Faecivivens stercoravium TaxID=2840803 RepID=A0A9D1DXR9_9FIRM|nr:GntR family transcriptional regulator [Candidatus Faecivivens stercoravium]
MTIIIQNSSPLPIYEQITRQVRAAILSGELKEGEMLPSVRALARDLRISVITTRRAYDELEREGYIQTVAGKGSFVGARSADLVREENLRQIENHLSEALKLGKATGLGVGELSEMLSLLDDSDN